MQVRDRRNEIMANHTGQTVEQVARDTDRDNFMGGTEAIKYGLIDTVLERRGKAGDDPEKAPRNVEKIKKK